MSARTRFKLIVYAILLVIAISLLVWWFLYNNAKSRDFERLADMHLTHALMLNYFSHYNSYQIVGCGENMPLHFCRGEGDRTLNVAQIIDPVNDGYYQYVVADLSDDDFAIVFALEVGVGDQESGSYVLSKKGITK